MELLRKLSSDVNFKYTVQILNSSHFSHTQNWTFLAHLVQTGDIDIVIGRNPSILWLEKKSLKRID